MGGLQPERAVYRKKVEKQSSIEEFESHENMINQQIHNNEPADFHEPIEQFQEEADDNELHVAEEGMDDQMEE
jgi:hypothetical protein